MNIDNAKKLVGQLERLPDEKFWMASWIIHPEQQQYRLGIPKKHRSCGTIACIAGWAQLLNRPRARLHPYTWAQKWLRLSEDDALKLFYGFFSKKANSRITRSDAIAELNRLIAKAKLP